MFKTKLLLFFGILFSFTFAHAQNFAQQEVNLQQLFAQMRKCATDTNRNQANLVFNKKLKSFISEKNAEKYNLQIQGLSQLISKDKRVAIYTWNLQNNDGSFTYFGFVKYRIKRRKYLVKELTDKSAEIKSPDNLLLNNKNWFGALYYDLVYTKAKGKRYYTLLGWDGNDFFTTKKLIDVLTIENRKVVFGKPILMYEKLPKSRIIIEYAASVKATLRYDRQYKMIVWDHLSPSKKELTGQFQYYGPDFTYDGLYFNKKIAKWEFYQEVKVKNGKEKTKKTNLKYSF